MSDEFPSWMDSLHGFPKIAEGLGQFMATFAAVERLLWFLYGKILGTQEEGARALLAHIDSFTLKLTAVENFLPFSSLEVRQRNIAAQFLVSAREYNTFRNGLAHGLYLSNGTGTKLVLITYAASTSRKAKEIPLTAELLQDKISKLILLRDGIRNEFFPDFEGSLSTPHRPPHIL